MNIRGNRRPSDAQKMLKLNRPNLRGIWNLGSLDSLKAGPRFPRHLAQSVLIFTWGGIALSPIMMRIASVLVMWCYDIVGPLMLSRSEWAHSDNAAFGQQHGRTRPWKHKGLGPSYLAHLSHRTWSCFDRFPVLRYFYMIAALCVRWKGENA